MVDKPLEERLRAAIKFASYGYGRPVQITQKDAKRLLLRLKLENAKGNNLVYRKDLP